MLRDARGWRARRSTVPRARRSRAAPARQAPRKRRAAAPSRSSAAAWPAWPPRTSWSSAASRSRLRAQGARRQGAQHPGAGHRRAAGAARCPASTASASSPASTTTCRTRCGGSRSRATRTASGTTSSTPTRASRRAPNGRAGRQLFGIAPDPRRGARRPRALQRAPDRGARSSSRASRRTRPQFFANRLMVFLTSCDERRYGQWEHTTLVGLRPGRGQVRGVPDGHRRGLTRTLVAAKETVASTRTIGNMAEAFVMNIMQRGNDGALDRVLNAPDQRGVDRPVGRAAAQARRALPRRPHGRGARGARGRIVARARARPPRPPAPRSRPTGSSRAMPVERARKLLVAASVLALDPALAGDERALRRLDERHPVLPARAGRHHPRPHHLRRRAVGADRADPGAVLGRARLRARLRRRHGRSTACRSTSPTGTRPGILYGKPAKQCTREEVAREVWAQIKAHLEDTGESVLPDDMLHSWFLDPAISWHPKRGGATATTSRCWSTRSARGRSARRRATKIPNLFLAGDYVQTDIDLATMEGANESGRAAVNALLDASGSKAEPRADVQALRPAGVRGRQGGRRRAVQRRASRTRSTVG